MRLIPVAAALLRNLLAHHPPTLVGSRAHRIPPRACNIGGGWRFQPLVNDSSSRGSTNGHAAMTEGGEHCVAETVEHLRGSNAIHLLPVVVSLRVHRKPNRAGVDG